jgi:hypothetical protein
LQTVNEFFESVLSGDQAQGIYEMAEDLPVPDEIAGVVLPKIRAMKFGQMIELRRGLRNDLPDTEISDIIGMVMTGQHPGEWPALEWLPYMLAVLKFIENSLKSEKKNLKYTPTADEKKAGIDRLNVFEDWGTIDSLVRTYPQYTHAEIAELQYTEVYMMQWRSVVLAKIERNMTKQNEKH